MALCTLHVVVHTPWPFIATNDGPNSEYCTLGGPDVHRMLFDTQQSNGCSRNLLISRVCGCRVVLGMTRLLR